jgi:ubiquinone/menaquinone biosynthesis C-methylase UbiE
MKHGDFTKLSGFYAQYRPGYSPVILTALLGLSDKENTSVQFADIGAGTGIWTRQVAASGCQVTAVEPNDAMRTEGIKQSVDSGIAWHEGSGEKTGLQNQSQDFVSMASSFHWPDFDKATAEFSRILKPNGHLVALWNPRHIQENPLLIEIEDYLKELVPDMKRVSSGKSVFCETLYQRLETCKHFEGTVYMQAIHTEKQSKERYIGLWRSVNDIRVQAGEKRFAQFLAFLDQRIADDQIIEAQYMTRAWVTRKKG